MTQTAPPFGWLRAVPLALGVVILVWSFLYSIPVLPLSAGPPFAQMRAVDAEQAFREQFEKAWMEGLGPREGESIQEGATRAGFVGKWGAWAKLRPGPFLAGASLAWIALSAILIRRRSSRVAVRARAASPYLIAASLLLSVVLIACTLRSRSMAISLSLAAAAPDVLVSSWLVTVGLLVALPRAREPAAPQDC
jgi:hypothetical protein